MQIRTGDGRLAEPYVCDFVSESEYLRSHLSVRAVHEHDGGCGVSQGKSAELVRVKNAMCVGADYAADHYQDACVLSQCG